MSKGAMGIRLPAGWTTRRLETVDEVIDVLLDLKGKRWLSRGQPRPYGNLNPGFDREPLAGLSRKQKLQHERSAIDLFRQTVRDFADEGETLALLDDVVALMVLQHYGFPTRLLDWSFSPHVAAFFATWSEQTEREGIDGELWSFDEPHYEDVGREQWAKWPETLDGAGDFEAGRTAFRTEQPRADWVVMPYFPRQDFPRQFAQQGAYTLTARFDRDHAEALARLFGDDSPSRCHRFVIASAIKADVGRALREDHGVWRGSLFPDSAGAAHTALVELRRNLTTCPGASRKRPGQPREDDPSGRQVSQVARVTGARSRRPTRGRRG